MQSLWMGTAGRWWTVGTFPSLVPRKCSEFTRVNTTCHDFLSRVLMGKDWYFFFLGKKRSMCPSNLITCLPTQSTLTGPFLLTLCFKITLFFFFISIINWSASSTWVECHPLLTPTPTTLNYHYLCTYYIVSLPDCTCPLWTLTALDSFLCNPRGLTDLSNWMDQASHFID